jgi:exopolysaccharide production protein ExoZ
MQKNLLTNRIESLDWLRGILAISVMFYHLSLWLHRSLDASSFLSRLGIFSVSGFFILSGLSMAMVYQTFFYNSKQILVFFIRRIIRIWPLLWLSALLIAISSKFQHLDLYRIFTTITTLFAFTNPSYYSITGAWSIGNEMVYYALTPLFLWAYNYRLWIGHLLFGFCILISAYFAFESLTIELNLADQWAIYVNPFNNLFYYVAGVAMYYFFQNRNLKVYWGVIFAFLSLLILIFMPAHGNQIVLVTFWNRFIFSIALVLLVVFFYKCQINLPRCLTYLLNLIGESAYGIYLLHPIVYTYLNWMAKKMGLISNPFLFISTSFLTILLAYCSYVFFEKPITQWGKKWTIRFI